MPVKLLWLSGKSLRSVTSQSVESSDLYYKVMEIMTRKAALCSEGPDIYETSLGKMMNMGKCFLSVV